MSVVEDKLKKFKRTTVYIYTLHTINSFYTQQAFLNNYIDISIHSNKKKKFKNIRKQIKLGSPTFVDTELY